MIVSITVMNVSNTGMNILVRAHIAPVAEKKNLLFAQVREPQYIACLFGAEDGGVAAASSSVAMEPYVDGSSRNLYMQSGLPQPTKREGVHSCTEYPKTSQQGWFTACLAPHVVLKWRKSDLLHGQEKDDRGGGDVDSK